MNNINTEFISGLLRKLLAAGAVFYIIVYVAVVFFRIQYPFELMWQEGASVDHVIWILSGNKYYVEPTLEFVSSIYTPLYFYISALVSKITGIGFFPLRFVSFISSLGCMYFLYVIVRKETGAAYPGILSAGLFAATFHISGAWFDIGRADSLFLVLLLAAIYIIRFKNSTTACFAAGVLISLSFFTKQTALVIALPVLLSCFLLDKRSSLYVFLPVAVFIGGGSVLLNYYYGGWFNYYVFELPRTTPVIPSYLVSFWVKDIVEPFVIALFMGVFYLLYLLLGQDRKKFLFYLFLCAGMFGASWYSRFRGGGYYNVLFPAYAMIAILFGLGFQKLSDIIKPLDIEAGRLIRIFLYLIVIGQFASSHLLYNPLDQVPSKKDLEAGNKLIAKLRGVEGEVYSSYHGYFAVMAGKKSYANQMGMRDVLTTDSEKHSRIKSEYIEGMKQAMRDRKFAAILIDSYGPWYPHDMKKYYARKERIFQEEDVFFPVTGVRTRPEFIYIPAETSSDN